MTGYSKVNKIKAPQIERRVPVLARTPQMLSASPEQAANHNENPMSTAKPQTVYRALQAGKLNQPQRQSAVSALAGVYGNQAIQRMLQEAKQPSVPPVVARETAPAAEDFRQQAVQDKYMAKLTSEHVKKQLNGNIFKLLALGGWHIGGVHYSMDVQPNKDDTKEQKKHKASVIAAENKLFEKEGKWNFAVKADEVIDYFNKIVEVPVPYHEDPLYMHEKAGVRLKNIFDILQSRHKLWPMTTVGQSFRGKLDPNESTASLHAHKLGFALDFRASTNPMIRDGRKRRLLSLMGGGDISIDLKKGHRAAIREMGKLVGKSIEQNKQALAKNLTVDFENVTKLKEVETFFSNRSFDEAYGKVKGVSDNFKTSLTAEAIQGLQTARDKLIELHTTNKDYIAATTLQVELSKLKKNAGKNAKLIAQKEAELVALKPLLNAASKDLRTTVQALLKPWATKVRQQVAALQSDYDGDKLKLDSQKAAAETAAANPELKAGKKGGKKSAKPDFSKATGELGKKQDELNYWTWLLDTLELKDYAHLDYVLEKGATRKGVEIVAEDPSILQLLTSGFFSPDKESSDDVAPTPAKKKKTDHSEHGSSSGGFDKEFVKLMLTHGFAWGATWGTPDTMHFELAEEVDNMPSSLRKYGGGRQD